MITDRYIIAHLLDDEVIAGGRFSKWPLHVTILPWFLDHPDETMQKLAVAVEDMRACRVSVGARILGPIAMYGDDEDVPVRPINNSTAVGVTHGILLTSFHSGLEDRTYVGGGYNPHLTIRDNNDPGEGFEFLLGSLSLIRHDGDAKTIVATHPLIEVEGA